MPRKARIDVTGALHHLVVRGIERQAIFRDDLDRDRFLERVLQAFGVAREDLENSGTGLRPEVCFASGQYESWE